MLRIGCGRFTFLAFKQVGTLLSFLCHGAGVDRLAEVLHPVNTKEFGLDVLTEKLSIVLLDYVIQSVHCIVHSSWVPCGPDTD